jgi:hypothetical protein
MPKEEDDNMIRKIVAGAVFATAIALTPALALAQDQGTQEAVPVHHPVHHHRIVHHYVAHHHYVRHHYVHHRVTPHHDMDKHEMEKKG